MEAPGMSFVAIRDIAGGGDTTAYMARVGDLVHESHVEPEGDLKIGIDVAARASARIDRPAKNASQGAWAAYAISQGANAETVADMSRAELIARYGEPADGALALGDVADGT